MSESTMPPPGGFRYATPLAIRYGDIDALGHVNNAKYLTYLEQSRVSYFRDMKLWDGSLSATGMILARVEMDFRAPITMDDGTAMIWTRVSRLGNRSFDMAHLVTVERAGERVVALESTSVVVVYDYNKNATTPIPDSWRTTIREFEPALD